MRLVDLVGEEGTVVRRFERSATHLGEWRGRTPTERLERGNQSRWVGVKANF